MNVKLPRFRIEATRNLEEEIRGLGVDAILTPGVADFTNMVRRNLINLSQFRHRYSQSLTHLAENLMQLCADSVFFSGHISRPRSGVDMGSMLPIRRKKLES